MSRSRQTPVRPTILPSTRPRYRAAIPGLSSRRRMAMADWVHALPVREDRGGDRTRACRRHSCQQSCAHRHRQIAFSESSSTRLP